MRERFMQNQVISKILETERQASRIVENSYIQSEQMVSDARRKADAEFVTAVGKAREAYQKEAEKLQNELEGRLKALEAQDIRSGVDSDSIGRIAARVVDYVANSVME